MKIERKYMAHYLNATFAADDGTASYVRLGKDLEEYSPELSATSKRKPTFLATRLSASTATRSRAKSALTTPRKTTRCLRSCRALSTTIWFWII